ncbi:MAG TPA: tetratricopeptide repeat protein [Phycisphaerae bacterium]|nr:tetratricopeptide repeat protein [Phycisphaerae bacterium]
MSRNVTHVTILALTALLLAGCGLENTQKEQAHQRWSTTRAAVICGVGEQHLKSGDLTKAGDRAAEALSLDEKCMPALVLMGRVQLEKGRYAAAEEQFHKAEALAPRHPDIPYLIGVSLEKRGKFDEALEAYQKAGALAPSNDASVIASAEVLVSSGKCQLALELLEARLERSEDELSMLALAGELAMLVGDPGKSADYYRRCLDLEPGHFGAREGLAKANFFGGHYAAALVDLQAIAADKVGGAPSSWVHLMIGDCHMAGNRPEEARRAYREAVRVDPTDAQIWMTLAKASLACDDPAEAARAARQAMSLGGDAVEATVVLACAALARGDPAAAAKLMERVAEQRGDDPTVLCMMGRCRAAQGRHDEAVRFYTRALRADPDHPLAKQLMASVALKDERGQ